MTDGPKGQNPFDAAAAFYDSWYDTSLGQTVDELEKDLLWHFASPARGELCLEVGVGTGHFAIPLATQGLRVVGVDLSRPMLDLARAKGSGISLIEADAGHIPLADAVFDLVICVTTLEFVSMPVLALSEMWRVVKTGGRAVVAVLNAWSPWAWGRAREFPFKRAHFFTPGEFVGLLRTFGRPKWSSSVFILPNGRGMRHAGKLECLGRRLMKPFGALLVGRVTKMG